MKLKRILLACTVVVIITALPFALINGNIRGSLKNNSTFESVHEQLSLDEQGLKKCVFDVALSGYLNLVKQCRISNHGIIAIADLSQPSTSKRLYVIDLINHKLLFKTWVAHGRNTGQNLATGFSNLPGSFQSSLGFYITGESYLGQHGLSLRLHGLEPGYNDKAYERAIVLHGADYVCEKIIKQTGRLGRSYGCPAVASELARPIINTLGEGTLMFVYYPDKEYLSRSQLL